MRHVSLCFLLASIFWLISSTGRFSKIVAQTIGGPAAIYAPLAGQALQGSIAITGNTAIDGFQSAELSFAYFNNPTEPWFLISQSNTPVSNGTLAQWDTTTLTDGVYNLRLIVTLNTGQQITAKVQGLRVRNYSLIETDTPTPVTPTATPVPGITPAPTVTPTPTITPTPTVTPTITPLPPNPAALSRLAVAVSIGQGALAAIGLFALIGLYQSVKRWIKKR